MSTINGFCSFYQDMSSLYWQRLCSLMKEKSVKDPKGGENYSDDNAVICVSKKGCFAENDNIYCFFAGNITNYKALKQKISDMSMPVGKNYGESFLYIYKALGTRGAAMVFGEFCAAIWDKSKKKLIIFSDKSGTYPLYYSYKNNRFVFSCAINSLLRFPGVYPTLNERGMADLFCMAGRNNPIDTPFEDIKRVPAGFCAEFSEKGVMLKSYYTLNPTDKFNAEFIAKDAIRLRGGKPLSKVNPPKNCNLLLSALKTVDYVSLPLFQNTGYVTYILKKQKHKKVYIPYLPPETKVRDLGFLLKKGIKGIDKESWEKDSILKYAKNMNIMFDDQMKLQMVGKQKLKINTLYSVWTQSLIRFAQMEEMDVILPLSDIRFLECVTDGGGDAYIYNGTNFGLDLKWEKDILLNELKNSKHSVFNILDRKELLHYIRNTEDSEALLYILCVCYWSSTYGVKTDFIA